MLTLRVEFEDKSVEEYGDISAVIMRKSLDTPADSLDITLKSVLKKRACKVVLLDSADEVFEGIADEQTEVYTDVSYTRIIARSSIALLLDNEANPEIFTNPSAELIISRYTEPCGIESSVLENKALSGVLRVYKGMSCYEVLKEFCQRVYSKLPSVEKGKLCLREEKRDSELLFSTSDEGVQCTKIEKNYSRYSLISRVFVRVRSDGAYDTLVEDKESSLSGILRQRYMDLSSLPVVSLSKAKALLSSGRQKALGITAVISKRLNILPGALARVKAGGEEYEGLVVRDILYTYKDKKESTKVTLCAVEE